jgi:hypothetical protein
MKTETLKLPSNRSFGWLFTGVFLLIGIFHPWLVGAAALMALVTLTRAQWLTPLNRAWMRFGLLLNRVVSPVVMGVLFFGLFTPMGWAMRRCGWDSMKRAYDPAAKSYWVSRDPPGPAEDSFRDPF